MNILSNFQEFVQKSFFGKPHSNDSMQTAEYYIKHAEYAGYKPSNYANIFSKNPMVYQCITLISGAVSELKYKMFLDSDDPTKTELTEITSSEILTLLKQPNLVQDWRTYVESFVISLLTTGNVFVKPTFVGDKIVELTVLDPCDVSLYIDNITKLPVSYQHNTETFAFDAITGKCGLFHFMLPTPFTGINMGYGLSPLQVVALTADTVSSGLLWNYNLTQNSGKLGGLLTPRDSLTAIQANDLKAQLDKFKGMSSQGEIKVLPVGLEFQQLGINPVDMDFLNTLNFSRETIASAFKIPLPLVNVDSATYNNRSSAKTELYNDNIIPLLNRILSSHLKYIVTNSAGDKVDITQDTISRLTIEIDKQSVPALKEELMKEMDAISKAMQAGVLTPNEAREKLGMPKVNTPEADTLLLKNDVIPAVGFDYNPADNQPDKQQQQDVNQLTGN